MSAVALKHLLKLVAFNCDFYREIYSRSLSYFAPYAGLSQIGIESFLRGLTYSHLSEGRRIYIGRDVVFVGHQNISLGVDVAIYGFCYLNAENKSGHIRIGERTHIDQFCVLYGQGGLEIGAGCAIASGVKLYSQSNQYKHDETKRILEQPVIYKKVTIGDDVWIGANAVVFPGVQIGQGAIIGAGAIVRHDVSSRAIVAGVPATIIGWRKSGKVEEPCP